MVVARDVVYVVKGNSQALSRHGSFGEMDFTTMPFGARDAFLRLFSCALLIRFELFVTLCERALQCFRMFLTIVSTLIFFPKQ